MSGTLALASAIAEMDRDALSALVSRRRPQAASGVIDPIGLASELLRPESIARALAPLERDALAALLGLGSGVRPEELDPLAELGLVGLDRQRPAELPEVTAELRSALRSAGLSAEELSEPPLERPLTGAESIVTDGRSEDPAADTSTWYAAAVTAVGQAAEILRVLRDRPGRLNRNGTIAVVTVRGLAESTGVDPDHTSRTLGSLGRAELLRAAPSAQLLRTSATAPGWLGLPHTERWLRLAAATFRSMTPALRTSLMSSDGDLSAAASALPHRFPLLPRSDVAAATSFVEAAEHLGLTVRGRLSDPAALLLAGAEEAARELAEREMPDPAPGVYVQPDLSVVVPGPLAPRDEAALSALSRPEHIGVASTRRITETSLAEALERGASAEEAREVFGRLSLTGIPQPLEYLLRSLAERAGSIRVNEHHGDEGRARIIVSRPELGETLLVDRTLQHLQLHRGAQHGPELFSRLRADHVVAALSDARYPASLVAPGSEPAEDPEFGAQTRRSLGSAGSVSPVASADLAAAGASAEAGPSMEASAPALPELPAELANLVERVYRAARSEPGTGDFTRLLELAIRDRSPVRVTAEARGQTHAFMLLPVSLSGGRLRATDQAAGVERTFPVNMITSVEAV